MSRVLLDNNVPLGVRRTLSSHEVKTAPQMKWDALKNGELLNAAELAGFAVMATADQNIAYQQNLIGRKLALVALQTNRWDTLRGKLAASSRLSTKSRQEDTSSYHLAHLPCAATHL